MPEVPAGDDSGSEQKPKDAQKLGSNQRSTRPSVATDDSERLAALRASGLLDSTSEEAYDRFTRLAARLLSAAQARISIVDADRQFVKSSAGPEAPPHGGEAPLEYSYCRYAVDEGATLTVEDAREDERLSESPAIEEGAIAYAGVPLTTEDGYVLGTLCAIDAKPRAWTAEDVDLLEELAASVMARVELRQAQRRADELTEQNAQYRHLVESAGEHAMFTMDPEGQITNWNAGAENIFGYTAEEAVGQPGAIIFTKEDRANGRPETEMAIARREGEAPDERWHVRKSGERLWADGTLTAMRSEDGTLTGFAKIVRDLTERREITLENERLASLVEHSADFIAYATMEGEVQYVNPAGRTLVGLEGPEEARGKHVEDFFLEGDLEVRRSEIQRSLDEEGRWQGELRLRHFRTGEAILVDRDLFVVEDPGTGEALSLVTISRDIRERKAREEALREAKDEAEKAQREAETSQAQAEKAQREAEEAQREAEEAQRKAEEANAAKSRFVANISHELRTPLNAVIGYSDRFRMDPANYDAESLAQGFERIYKSGHQLLNLINDVLDLTKAQSGRLRVSLEDFDLADFATATAEEMRAEIEKNGNTFEVEGLERAGEVRTDPAKLRQILYNLLSNAGKYTEEGTVTLAVEVREGEEVSLLPEEGPTEERTAEERDALLPEGPRRELVIRVTDTGIGLTETEQADVFEAFERSEDVEAVRGTGLGLQIVQNLCEILGGRVEVESTKGEGSTFTVRLPAGPAWPSEHTGEAEEEKTDDRARGAGREPASRAASGHTEENQLPPQQEGLVLVIDDDRDARVLLRNHLREAGFDVETASTGAEGIEQAYELHPMAITLDVLMGDTDGWEVLARLKHEDSPLRHVPVVMVTITPNEGRAFRLGASEHVVKPVSKKRLTELLGTYRQEASPSLAVLIVDDDEAVRDRVRGVIEGHAEGDGRHTVHEAPDEAAARTLIEDEGLAPDLILLNLGLPEPLSFLESLRAGEHTSSAAVFALIDERFSAEQLARLNDQVEGILLKKTYTREDLLHAVHQQMETLRQRVQREGGSANNAS